MSFLLDGLVGLDAGRGGRERGGARGAEGSAHLDGCVGACVGVVIREWLVGLGWC